MRQPPNGHSPGPQRFGAIALIFAVLLTALTPLTARADGVIIVDPPPCEVQTCPPFRIGDGLIVKSHRVEVTIRDQVAVTTIDQVFFNPHDFAAEGTYIFPVPVDAAVSQFSMIVDGVEVEANLLDADEARRVYDEIVRSMRDPALLEYVGRGAIQASVFPIPPGDERRVQITYEQVLSLQDGLVRYVYPLNTEKFSAAPLEQASVRVSVESSAPIRAIYSPSHTVSVTRESNTSFVAGWEAANVLPSEDFALYYSVAQDQVGVSLLSTYDPLAGEGHFLLLAAPGIDATTEIVARDVIVVLDTSGSMSGEKMEQARTALSFILDNLNPEDRFAIVEFSTGVRTYHPTLLPASDAADAQSWVKRLEARGGTDINRALLEGLAYVQPDRPAVVLFLTDGLPTEGEIDPDRIVANATGAAAGNVRIFPFGVGYDVDTVLLDTLAQAQGGRTTYVQPGEPLDEVVSGFWGQVGAPVLGDLHLDFGDIIVEDMHPDRLPDLFRGGQLVLAGRYREGGPTTITLTGTVNNREYTYVYGDITFATEPVLTESTLPRIWASRRIGYLLNQIRLTGESPELVQAVIDLSVKYGIVTPYTSYLITEDDILTSAGRERAAQQQLDEAMEAPAAPTSGEAAVTAADAATDLERGEVAAAPSVEHQGEIRIVGSRAFVRRGDIWVETTFDPDVMEPIEVEFLSDEYFALISEHPDLAEAFALGDQVIAVSDGVAYQVVVLDDNV